MVRQIELFEPPMCCPTGVCGPSPDPVLLEVQETIGRMDRESNGQVEVVRNILGKDPQAFLRWPEVMSVIRTDGLGALPITMVDGEIIKTGTYPSYEELVCFLESEGVDV